MTTKYPGGLIRKTPPTITPPVDGEGGSAPGVWTLEQASYYTKTGTWPKPVLPREAYTWGRNDNGVLGQNDSINRSSPTQLGSASGWSTVSTGGSNAHQLLTRTDGTLWAIGRNDFGQLGINSTVFRSSPVQVGALTNWSSASVGVLHSVALKTDGTLWLWGANNYGQLGLNITAASYRSSPVQLGSLTTWSKIASGGNAVLAIQTDGTLWSWGKNDTGQLGQNVNASTNRSSPVQVGALTNWSKISFGSRSWTSVKTDGTLWCCGYNNWGQLGNNSTAVASASSPIQIGALTTWLNPAAGYYQSVITKTDGTLWSFGLNNHGQLGVNNSDSYSSPVQIGALTTWLKPSSGYGFSFAIKTDGTLWGWGQNTAGQLGKNDVIKYSSPIQIGSATNWDQINASFYFSAGITKG